MALYGVRLVINLFDLCIYRRYLEEFIGNRKTSMEFSVLLLIVCELIGSAVNQMGISWLNFVTMVAILCGKRQILRLPLNLIPRLACVKPVASVHPEPGSNSTL